nr:MAG: hypothetical protein AmFV_00231 [Apis mellifera filamentous virus]WOK43344.1 MAG: hypothetical protein [Apis mellifera filamentous virus]
MSTKPSLQRSICQLSMKIEQTNRDKSVPIDSEKYRCMKR